MRVVFQRAAFLLVVAAFCISESLAELKAFPTAEGYGRLAKGGRGGRIIEVTNLNDSGPGSLRDAVLATGPRTVVFNVSGVITLASKLVIKNENKFLTVAGQTAPGKGVVVHGWTFGMIGGEHVILRFIRTRVGTSSGKTMDGMGITGSKGPNIYDHCSISWTIDEGFSSRGTGEANFTLQRTMISEALNEAGHDKYGAGAQHGYAASIGGEIGSFHHNLLAHCAGRNWSLAGGLYHGTVKYAGKLDIRNNVVYNWKHRTTDGGAFQVNFVNNYYKPGPASETFVALNAQNDGFEGGQWYYFTGNVMEGRWDESNQEKGRIATGKKRDYNPWVDKPFFESYVETQSAREAYEDVLDNVGANRPMLDDHDMRIIREVREGTYTYKGSKTGLPGLPDNEADVGGLEEYPGERRPPDWDTDHDGMPDDWETAHGLNPSDAEDRNATNLSAEGYTNLEMYLNELAGDSLLWKNPVAVRQSRTGLLESVRASFNPAAGAIELTAASRLPLDVDLLDAAGRRLSVLYRGIPSTEKTAFPAKEALRSGKYLVRVSSGNEVRNVPITVAR